MTHMRRLLKMAEERVITEWTGPAFEKLGSRIQRALLAESVLILAATQDDSVDAEIVRRIVNEGWTWSIDRSGY